LSHNQPEWIILNGRAVTAVLEILKGEAPLWRYWGPRLPDGVTPQTALRTQRPEPSFSPQFDQPLSLFPGTGVGWFGEPALKAHRGGEDWTFQATRCAVEQNEGRALVMLNDDVAQIQVRITLALDPESDVMAMSTSLTNGGETPLDIGWLASGTVALPDHARNVRSFSGRHNVEFVVIDDVLSRSQWRRENRRGLTSHDCFPGAVVTTDGAAYGAQLAWSGNHVQLIEWIDDGRWQWQMGEGLAPGEVRLAPGGRIEMPDMFATCAADANGVAQNFHRAMRKIIGWPKGQMQPRPVHLNTWEGFYFDHDEAALKQLADAAASIGIERFVLDDGWFAGRNDDTSSLGDWWADARKYPEGLKPLADHVTALGMEFGLWVEPEMVNPDSDLYRAHPDWALATPGRPLIPSRHQLVLDMRRDDVREYLFGTISALLETLPIGYLKWDHNRDLIAAGQTPAFREQVKGSYALMARLRGAFPHVEIEACAGGGGRIDAGVLEYCHRFWASDNIDAVSRVAIQRGFLQFMPPEIMGAHVGASPAHATGRNQSMDFRGAVALPGHFGVELDVRKLDVADRARLAASIATYKAHRQRLHRGQLWMGESADGLVWQAHGEIDDLLLLVYRLNPQSQRHAPGVKLPMLDGTRQYRVNGEVHDGAWLAAHGLSLPPMKAESCLILEVTAL
jgi:alpha-galactosidase